MSAFPLSVPLLLVSVAVPEEIPPDVLPDEVWAYESFDAIDPDRAIVGSVGGSGWAGPWMPHPLREDGPNPREFPRRADHLRGAAGSLRYPGVSSRGGAATSAALPANVGAVTRPVEIPTFESPKTLYVGLLVQPKDRLYAGAKNGGVEVYVGWTGPDGRLLPQPKRRGVLPPFSESRRHAGRSSFGKPWRRVVRPSWRCPFGLCSPSYENLEPRDLSRTWDWCLSHRAECGPSYRRAFGRPAGNPVGTSRTIAGGGDAFGRLQAPVGLKARPGLASFFVLKLEIVPELPGTRYGLLYDPDPTRPEPPSHATFVDGAWNYKSPHGPTHLWVTLANSGAVTFDELRVATSFAGAAGRTAPAGE